MTDAQAIVEGLGGKWSGDQGVAHCPSHEDNTPSLSVSESDGRVLVYCHAGCSQDSVIDALRTQGLWPGGSALPQDRGKMADRAEQREFDDYKRLKHALAFFYRAKPANGCDSPERKEFRRYLRGRGIKKVPDNAYRIAYGSWPAMAFPVGDPVTGNFKGAHITTLVDGQCGGRYMHGPIKGGIVPFRKLRNGNGDLLCIAEGIETSLSVRRIARCETWAALSAGNMARLAIPANYREVIVCADNDENQAGLNAANKLAERLVAEGRTVRVAVPEKVGRDWNDVLLDAIKADRPITKLRKKILRAPLLEAPERSMSWQLLDAPTLLKTIADLPVRSTLIKPWFPDPGLVMMHAKPGVGKTYLSLWIGAAVASGMPFLDWDVQANDVVYLDAELSRDQLGDRIRDAQTYFGDDLRRLRFLNTEIAAISDIDMPNLSDSKDQKELASVLEGARLIILDSLATLSRTGNPDRLEDWRGLQAWLQAGKAQGQSVLLVHHSGKSGSQLGTTGHEIIFDTILRLERPQGYQPEQGAKFNLIFEKSRGVAGPEVATREVAMARDDAGHIVWQAQSSTKSSADRIREQIEDDPEITNAEIAKELNVTPSWVRQVRKKMGGES